MIRRFPNRIGRGVYTLSVEPVANGRWYAEARHGGALCAAGSGDTLSEALAFVQAILAGLAREERAA